MSFAAALPALRPTSRSLSPVVVSYRQVCYLHSLSLLWMSFRPHFARVLTEILISSLHFIMLFALIYHSHVSHLYFHGRFILFQIKLVHTHSDSVVLKLFFCDLNWSRGTRGELLLRSAPRTWRRSGWTHAGCRVQSRSGILNKTLPILVESGRNWSWLACRK